MPITQKVALEGIRFFAHHGFYPEEQLIGTEFIVDIAVEMSVTSSGDDELNNTVNYEKLFEIAGTEMRNTRKLLETVAHGMLSKVLTDFPLVQKADVSIRKMHLPIKGEVRNSLVQLSYSA